MKSIPKKTWDRIQQLNNDAVSELVTMLADLHSDARCWYDGRSEKWQEGDAAANYEEWITTLEQASECVGELQEHLNALQQEPEPS